MLASLAPRVRSARKEHLARLDLQAPQAPLVRRGLPDLLVHKALKASKVFKVLPVLPAQRDRLARKVHRVRQERQARKDRKACRVRLVLLVRIRPFQDLLAQLDLKARKARPAHRDR